MRSKKLCSIDVDEKLRLGRELRLMDREQDKLEAELNKQQDREVCALRFRDSRVRVEVARSMKTNGSAGSHSCAEIFLSFFSD